MSSGSHYRRTGLCWQPALLFHIIPIKFKTVKYKHNMVNNWHWNFNLFFNSSDFERIENRNDKWTEKHFREPSNLIVNLETDNNQFLQMNLVHEDKIWFFSATLLSPNMKINDLDSNNCFALYFLRLTNQVNNHKHDLVFVNK